MKQQLSLTEHIYSTLAKLLSRYQVVIIATLISATLAYLFMFLNKIPNWDDMQFLFGKGYTLTSGRWGLDILSNILPNYSIPWLWGYLSIFLLTISICLIVSIFNVKNKYFQIVLSAVIVTFPSQIGTFFYMFTSSSYAVAFLFAVSAVYVYERFSFKGYIPALVLAILSCSIYQAYIAVVASFFVLLLIQRLCTPSADVCCLIKQGIMYVIFLAISLGLYYGITLLILHNAGSELNAWAVRATTGENNILYRVYRAWILFLAVILKQSFGLIPTSFSATFHVLFLIIAGCSGLWLILKQKSIVKTLIYVILVGVFLPLSTNCLVILLGENGIHALTLYSFISLYLFAVIIIEKIPSGVLKNICLDVAVLGISIAIICNIYSANKAYFKQYLVYENTVSFYQSIITQIQNTPGFSEQSKIAIIGAVPQDSSYLEEFGPDTIYGQCGFKGEAISDDFITYYLGFDLPFANSQEKQQIVQDIRYIEMNSYPYYGYIQEIDGFIVVKLGD